MKVSIFTIYILSLKNGFLIESAINVLGNWIADRNLFGNYEAKNCPNYVIQQFCNVSIEQYCTSCAVFFRP